MLRDAGRLSPMIALRARGPDVTTLASALGIHQLPSQRVWIPLAPLRIAREDDELRPGRLRPVRGPGVCGRQRVQGCRNSAVQHAGAATSPPPRTVATASSATHGWVAAGAFRPKPYARCLPNVCTVSSCAPNPAWGRPAPPESLTPRVLENPNPRSNQEHTGAAFVCRCAKRIRIADHMPRDPPPARLTN